MEKKCNLTPLTDTVDPRTKWSYCVGCFGRDFACTIVNMFLITYIQYTMRLTTAQFSAITAIMIACICWDAINDPIMGMIIENTHMKFGKYKPWILIGVALNVVFLVMLFNVRPEGWGFVAAFGVIYLFWGMTYTMNDISFWGVLPSLTSSPTERDRITTYLIAFASIGAFVSAGSLPLVVTGNAVRGYGMFAVVAAVLFLLFQLLTVFGIKERPRRDTEEKVSVRQMFRILGQNDQLVTIAVTLLLYTLGSGLLIAFCMNFFYFEFGYGGIGITIFTAMYAIATLTSQLMYPLFTRRMNRQKIIVLSIAISIVGYLMLLGFGYVLPKTEILLYAIGLIVFYGQGLLYMPIIVMLTNTIEYNEYKTGHRHETVIFSIRPFIVKVASAVQQGVVVLVLIISGIYGLSQGIADLEIQKNTGAITDAVLSSRAAEIVGMATPGMRLVLRLGMVAVPLILYIAAYLIVKKKYRIDEKAYDNMVMEIAARRGEPVAQTE